MLEKNSQFIFKAKEVLKRITHAGSVGYIVGDSVRQLMLDMPVECIEIFTILKKESVRKLLVDLELLRDDNKLVYLFDGVKISISFISTYNFNAEKFNEKYVLKQNENVSFTLINYLIRYDFTINTMAMSGDNAITDVFKGLKDLKKKTIRSIYLKPQQHVDSNPLVILKGLKLVSELGFKLERKTKKAFKAKARKIKQYKPEDISMIVRDILTGPYYKNAYKYIIKLGIYKYLKGFKYSLKRLKDGYDNINKLEYDKMLATNMIKHKKYMDGLANSAFDEMALMRIVNLGISNPRGDYDALTLYSYSLVELVKANQINNSIGRSRLKTKEITRRYDSLPIKKTCDLAFKGEDILQLVYEKTGKNYNGSPELSDMVDAIIYAVLTYEIQNTKDDIRQFVLNNLETILHCEINRNLIKKTDEGQTDNYEEFYHEAVNKEESSEDLIHKLRNDLENEIEQAIQKSGMLEGLTGKLRESSYETLRKVYYDITISKVKYERLRKDV